MEPADIPLDDPKTYQLLSSGNTLGVFQVEGSGMQQLLRKVRPSRLEDVSAVVALYRPGPMGAGAHHEYARRKASGDHRAAVHPELDDLLTEVLQETYGLIVYQEQVMTIINRVTGWDYAESEDIFTAMRKKDHAKLDKARPEFYRAAKKLEFSASSLDALWEILVPFADYSFNKSHSVGYAHITVWTAYLKAHHPKEYMTTLMSRSKDITETMKWAAECQRMGIPVLPPDVNDSGMGFTPTKEGIRYGISAIKGVGDSATAALLSQRPYRSLDDFFRRADPKVLNAGVLQALAKSGALDSLWGGREALVEQGSEIASVAIEDRRQQRHGQRRIIPVRYRPKAGSAQKDSRLRAAWELGTIGVALTHPTVTLRPTRRLSALEWEWAWKVVQQHPGPQKVVTATTWGAEIEGRYTCTYSDTLVSNLALVGIEVTEQ